MTRHAHLRAVPDRPEPAPGPTASHQLRTPPAGTAASTHLLQDEVGLKRRQRELVASIARDADRVAVLAEDLLLLSNLDGRPVLARRETEPHPEPRRPDLPDPVDVADSLQLERLVLSMMSNALKAAGCAGTVSCRLSTRASAADPSATPRRHAPGVNDER